jgi:hypothetical protein
MLLASLGKVVHTVKRAGTYAAKVPPQELHKIAVRERAVCSPHNLIPSSPHPVTHCINAYPCTIHRGGGGQPVRRLEGRYSSQEGSKYQHDWLYLHSINSIKHQYRRHLGFAVFIIIWSLVHGLEPNTSVVARGGGVKTTEDKMHWSRWGSPSCLGELLGFLWYL